jgi:hypothetical protein
VKLTDITVTRVVPALAEQVFDVWMDPRVQEGRGLGPTVSF